MSTRTPPIEEQTLSPEQAILADHIGNEVYASHYAERRAYRLILACGILLVTSAHMRAFCLVSHPLLGITLRAYPAPCGKLALLLWLRPPPGYGFRLRRTLRKCRASALGAGATRSLREG